MFTLPGCAAHTVGMSNVIPFRPKHKSAGTVRDGKKVGGQFDYVNHDTADNVVLSAPAEPVPSGSSGGPLRTIPETLRMAYLPNDVNEVRNDLVHHADARARAEAQYFQRFSDALEGDIAGTAEAKRLYDDAVGFARAKDFDSLAMACQEAASYAPPERRMILAGALETYALGATISHDDVENNWNRRAFMDRLEFLDRDEAREAWDEVVHALDNGGDVEKVCAAAAARNAAAHPGGLLKNGYRPPGGKIEPGYAYGVRTTGGNYKGWIDATEAAALVRKELKAAQEGNYLPSGLKFSVTRDKYSGGQSVRVTIQGLPDADRLDPVETNQWGDPADRREVRELRRRVEGITNAWNDQDIDSQTDYFNVVYYGSVNIEDDRMREFREREAATRKARKAQREAASGTAGADPLATANWLNLAAGSHAADDSEGARRTAAWAGLSAGESSTAGSDSSDAQRTSSWAMGEE